MSFEPPYTTNSVMVGGDGSTVSRQGQLPDTTLGSGPFGHEGTSGRTAVSFSFNGTENDGEDPVGDPGQIAGMNDPVNPNEATHGALRDGSNSLHGNADTSSSSNRVDVLISTIASGYNSYQDPPTLGTDLGTRYSDLYNRILTVLAEEDPLRVFKANRMAKFGLHYDPHSTLTEDNWATVISQCRTRTLIEYYCIR